MKIAPPEEVVNVVKCKNPRCITSIERELPQVRQRGVSRPEVVERDLNAGRVQAAQAVLDALLVRAEQHAFRHLDAEALRADPGLRRQLEKAVEEGIRPEIGIGEVHRHAP